MQLGNTLTEPHFREDKPFDAIVSNPPYSVKWVGSDDPTLINDDRFAPASVLAPKSKADFAFVLHALNYLSSKGRAAIVCFPGIFYRGGAEQKIRQYLVDNNYVETVISLAPNLFYGTTIAVTILVLSKSKTDTKVQFIDASGEDFFKKGHQQQLADRCPRRRNHAALRPQGRRRLRRQVGAHGEGGEKRLQPLRQLLRRGQGHPRAHQHHRAECRNQNHREQDRWAPKGHRRYRG